MENPKNLKMLTQVGYQLGRDANWYLPNQNLHCYRPLHLLGLRHLFQLRNITALTFMYEYSGAFEQMFFKACSSVLNLRNISLCLSCTLNVLRYYLLMSLRCYQCFITLKFVIDNPMTWCETLRIRASRIVVNSTCSMHRH